MKIEELTLFSANLSAQEHFYARVLGFHCLERHHDKVVFRAGRSRLIIEKIRHTHPVHFAFIIPGDSFAVANIWLRNRVRLLAAEGKEILDFPAWNAKAQYFYDADHNIVEFIARRDVEGKAPTTFSADAVLRIGEVGLPSEDLEGLYKQLNSLHPVPKYDGDFKRFGAAGDPEGLFILVNPEEKDWYPIGDRIMPAHVRVRGDLNFEYNNETLTAINNAL